MLAARFDVWNRRSRPPLKSCALTLIGAANSAPKWQRRPFARACSRSTHQSRNILINARVCCVVAALCRDRVDASLPALQQSDIKEVQHCCHCSTHRRYPSHTDDCSFERSAADKKLKDKFKFSDATWRTLEQFVQNVTFFVRSACCALFTCCAQLGGPARVQFGISPGQQRRELGCQKQSGQGRRNHFCRDAVSCVLCVCCDAQR